MENADISAKLKATKVEKLKHLKTLISKSLKQFN